MTPNRPIQWVQCELWGQGVVCSELGPCILGVVANVEAKRPFMATFPRCWPACRWFGWRPRVLRRPGPERLPFAGTSSCRAARSLTIGTRGPTPAGEDELIRGFQELRTAWANPLVRRAESSAETHRPRLLQIAFFLFEFVRGFHPGKHSKGLAVATQTDDLLHNLLTMLPVEPVLKAALPLGAATSGNVLYVSIEFRSYAR